MHGHHTTPNKKQNKTTKKKNVRELDRSRWLALLAAAAVPKVRASPVYVAPPQAGAGTHIHPPCSCVSTPRIGVAVVSIGIPAAPLKSGMARKKGQGRALPVRRWIAESSVPSYSAGGGPSRQAEPETGRSLARAARDGTERKKKGGGRMRRLPHYSPGSIPRACAVYAWPVLLRSAGRMRGHMYRPRRRDVYRYALHGHLSNMWICNIARGKCVFCVFFK